MFPIPKAWQQTVGVTALATALVALVAIPLASVTIDDAFITFRQADRFAHGHLSFNAGAPVEASSSLLSTLLLAMLARAGVEVETAAKLLGGAAAVLCAAVIAWLIQVRRREPPGASAVVWLLPFAAALTSPWMSAWWFMGLETSLWSAILLTAAVAVSLHSAGTSPGAFAVAVVACAAGTIARPEAPLILGTWLLALAVLDRRARRPLLRLALVVALTALAVGAFRLQVYGQWFPNPVYVKASGRPGRAVIGQGLRYLLSAVTHPPRVFPVEGTLVLIFGALAAQPWLRAWRAAADRIRFPSLLPRVAPRSALPRSNWRSP